MPERLLLAGYLFTNQYVVLVKGLLLTTSYAILHASSCTFESKSMNRSAHSLEFPILYVLALFFLLVLVGANHLLSSFLALVGFSLNMYVLILAQAYKHGSREAGIKYYYLSTISTGLIIYGMFLLYVFSQGGIFAQIDTALAVCGEDMNTTLLARVGFLFMFLGFMFKLSAVPGHL